MREAMCEQWEAPEQNRGEQHELFRAGRFLHVHLQLDPWNSNERDSALSAAPELAPPHRRFPRLQMSCTRSSHPGKTLAKFFCGFFISQHVKRKKSFEIYRLLGRGVSRSWSSFRWKRQPLLSPKRKREFHFIQNK